MKSLPTLFFRKTGDGPPVVILHGLFGMSDNWQSFAKQLSQKGFTVFTVDLRNHGQSFHDENFNYTLMAYDLAIMLDKEQIQNPTIIGHSMGGKVAMQYGFDYPNKINKLMIIDIAPRYYSLHHQEVLVALNAIDLSKINSRKEVENIWNDFKLETGTKQFLLKNLFWKNDKQLAWRFNLEAITNNIDEVGKAITFSQPFFKPALFISGEYSGYIQQEDHQSIKNMFPMAELKTAPLAGHWVHADNPIWLLEVTINYLSDFTF